MKRMLFCKASGQKSGRKASPQAVSIWEQRAAMRAEHEIFQPHLFWIITLCFETMTEYENPAVY